VATGDLVAGVEPFYPAFGYFSACLKYLRSPDDLLSMAIPLAILCALALAATGVSFFALFCAKALASNVGRRISDLESRVQSALLATETKLAELAAEARDRDLQPAAPVVPARLRPGLNLSTRSQVLRLHRHGEPAENIARVLEVPRQEVDLLLKVHGIVMKNI